MSGHPHSSYAYTANTNRLASVTDNAPLSGRSHGFNPGAGGAGYTCDANGNLRSDSYKGITNITYNHLNLPRLISFSTGNSIEIVYDAGGQKLRKIVKTGATIQYEHDYAGGLEYRKTGTGSKRIEAVYHAEGRYFNLNVDANNTVAWRREYALRDHPDLRYGTSLGNTRVIPTFGTGQVPAYKNGNGIIEVTNNPATCEIIQENHYYHRWHPVFHCIQNKISIAGSGLTTGTYYPHVFRRALLKISRLVLFSSETRG